MGRYIIRRLLWMIPVILGVLLIVFALSAITPGDPVDQILGVDAPIEDKEANWKRAVAWSTGLTAGAAVLIGLMPYITGFGDGKTKYRIGSQATFERFWQYVLVALAGLLVFVLIYKKFFSNKRKFIIASTVFMLAVAYVASFMVIGTGVMVSNTTEPIKNDIINSRGHNARRSLAPRFFGLRTARSFQLQILL